MKFRIKSVGRHGSGIEVESEAEDGNGDEEVDVDDDRRLELFLRKSSRIENE